MLLKKTKLAGIISLVLCTTAVASTTAIVVDSSGAHDFGPYVSAMDTSSTATGSMTSATYTQKYAQQFSYDIGAPWTYNEYCVYDSDVCKMFWDGSKTDNSDGLFVWRRNILNTYNSANGTYESETETSVNDTVISIPRGLSESRKITAITSTDQAGYATDSGLKIVRRGFYNDITLAPLGFDSNGGFSAAHDFTDVYVSNSDKTITYSKRLIVGQASVRWSGNKRTDERFKYCFNYPVVDDRNDYDDLYNCPGFDLQASYWNDDGSAIAYLSDNSGTKWLNTGSNSTFIANAYAINTSGFAVGFSTQQINSSTNGGRARATIFKPTVKSADALSYKMTEITKPKTDAGSDYDNVIRDTVAIDITDTVYVSASSPFAAADGTDSDTQAFIVVGNRTYNQPQNRSYATEFYTYDVKTQETRYPFQANPIKGASSQVSKINNDGIVVGWRDARGETTPTADGSPRFQSAFIYDYKTKKSAYLDDLYCQGIDNSDVKYRFANAISISDPDANGNVVVVSNAFDYKNVDNYKNRIGSTPVVLTMTITADELANLSTTSQCPIKAEEDYSRSGGSMNWFILLPTMLLLFRRFKR
ncbi:hypothetical protein AKG98_2082 [Moritella sp. JT01]|uniref:DUF3466 family protein n=1 Tax=Moritella sp. JT01 TaxID=756698 RepID=UPI0007948B89|nr:DUF3466 family protein [Moritella sp. JT01]KXO08031.1 hypothetical protein AKG98_2082 [Moritella sp. JT01]